MHEVVRVPVAEEGQEIAAKEIARATLKRLTPAEPLDRFKISLEPGASAITLTWGGDTWATDIRAGK